MRHGRRGPRPGRQCAPREGPGGSQRRFATRRRRKKRGGEGAQWGGVGWGGVGWGGVEWSGVEWSGVGASLSFTTLFFVCLHASTGSVETTRIRSRLSITLSHHTRTGADVPLSGFRLRRATAREILEMDWSRTTRWASRPGPPARTSSAVVPARALSPSAPAASARARAPGSDTAPALPTVAPPPPPTSATVAAALSVTTAPPTLLIPLRAPSPLAATPPGASAPTPAPVAAPADKTSSRTADGPGPTIGTIATATPSNIAPAAATAATVTATIAAAAASAATVISSSVEAAVDEAAAAGEVRLDTLVDQTADRLRVLCGDELSRMATRVKAAIDGGTPGGNVLASVPPDVVDSLLKADGRKGWLHWLLRALRALSGDNGANCRGPDGSDSSAGTAVVAVSAPAAPVPSASCLVEWFASAYACSRRTAALSPTPAETGACPSSATAFPSAGAGTMRSTSPTGGPTEATPPPVFLPVALLPHDSPVPFATGEPLVGEVQLPVSVVVVAVVAYLDAYDYVLVEGNRLTFAFGAFRVDAVRHVIVLQPTVLFGMGASLQQAMAGAMSALCVRTWVRS